MVKPTLRHKQVDFKAWWRLLPISLISTVSIKVDFNGKKALFLALETGGEVKNTKGRS